MATLSKSKLFASPKMDSRIKSANTQGSERALGYFVGPCFVYMAYYAIAGTYLTQFYTDVLGITGVFLTLMPVISKIIDAVTNIVMGRIIDKTRTRQAQAESESLSTNVKWGFRKRFADGAVYYHYDTLLGYRRGPDGAPEIDEEQAAVVRRIFARYLMGQSYQQICDGLMADGIKTAPGCNKWCGSTVKSILKNEKYVGDSLQQKTFSEDLFDGQRVKNEGQLPKYYVHDCHPAIIDRFTFQRVQEELARRSTPPSPPP